MLLTRKRIGSSRAKPAKTKDRHGVKARCIFGILATQRNNFKTSYDVDEYHLPIAGMTSYLREIRNDKQSASSHIETWALVGFGWATVLAKFGK